jgi:hypothetical protein
MASLDIECFHLAKHTDQTRLSNILGLQGTEHESESFMVDSGAARHCCRDPNLFKNLRSPRRPEFLVTASGERMQVTSVGDVDVHLMGRDGKMHTITLHNVAYCPELHFNLISVKRMWKDSRLKTVFGSTCYFKEHGTNTKYMFAGDRTGDLYNVGCVTARNKHFDRCFHLIREQVSYLKLKLVHVKTHDQLADYLTKPLDEFNFLKCREFSMKGTK